MVFSKIIIGIMAVFALLGGIDRMFGNRFGLGAEYENGFHAMGPLALGMVGINCLAPLMAEYIVSIFEPLAKLMGADVAVFTAVFISVDTGGYPLAHSIAESVQIADFISIIIGSMLAPTLAFSIPIGLGMIKKKDIPCLAIGSLSGLISIPFASFLGGIIMKLPLAMVLKNLFPIFIISVTLALALLFSPQKTIFAFSVFAKIVICVLTFGLTTAIFQELSGVVLLRGLAPLSQSFKIIGEIAIVLAGAYPFIFVVTKLFDRNIKALSKLLKINAESVSGLIASLANSIPMMTALDKMDSRGKTLNFAFASCAAFVFGDHLGYCAAVSPQNIMPMVVSKLTGGFLAIAIAYVLYERINISD